MIPSFFLLALLVVNPHLCEVVPPPTEDTVEETQHAVCKIITQEIQTSANATIRRQLKGICTTKQIERKFRQLERKLLAELQHIKEILNGRTSPPVENTGDYEYYDQKSLDQKATTTLSETITNEFSYFRSEINQLNNTINDENIFTYFWKFQNIRDFFQKGDLQLQSPYFVILGHHLHIVLYSKFENFNYLGVELKFTSNFSKRHRFTILDQTESTKDIVSPSLDPLSTGVVYRVPYAKLEERNYLDHDTLFLKLTVYLNS